MVSQNTFQAPVTIGPCEFCTLPVTDQNGMRYSPGVRYPQGRIEHHACGDRVRTQEVASFEALTTFSGALNILLQYPQLREFMRSSTDGQVRNLSAENFARLMSRILPRVQQVKCLSSQDMAELLKRDAHLKVLASRQT